MSSDLGEVRHPIAAGPTPTRHPPRASPHFPPYVLDQPEEAGNQGQGEHGKEATVGLVRALPRPPPIASDGAAKIWQVLGEPLPLVRRGIRQLPLEHLHRIAVLRVVAKVAGGHEV